MGFYSHPKAVFWKKYSTADLLKIGQTPQSKTVNTSRVNQQQIFLINKKKSKKNEKRMPTAMLDQTFTYQIPSQAMTKNWSSSVSSVVSMSGKAVII